MSSKAYFERVAGAWDSMRRAFFSDGVREAACRAAGVQHGQLAGDLGAGTGYVTESLLDRGLHVIAVDESPAMLAHLAANVGGDAAVETRVGRAERLPIETASLDCAFANMYLHHVERPDTAIREAYRTLKPGGVLVVTDLDAHDHEFLRDEHNDTWLGFDRRDIRRWFADAGFGDVAVDGIGESCTSCSADGRDAAAIGIFRAVGVA